MVLQGEFLGGNQEGESSPLLFSQGNIYLDHEEDTGSAFDSLGECTGYYSHTPTAFAASLKQRCTHTQILGNSGTGKSNLLYGMIVKDIIEGRGVCLVEPQGKLYQEVLGFCLNHILEEDPTLVERLVIIDPDIYCPRWLAGKKFSGFCTGFDPLYLKYKTKASIDVLAKTITTAVLKSRGIITESDTPLLAKWLYYSFYALIETDRPFSDVLHLISTDKHYEVRKEIISEIKNELVSRKFKELIAQNNRELLSQLSSTQNVLEKFLSSPFIHDMFTHPMSIDIEHIMDNNGILLVNTSSSSSTLEESDGNMLAALLLSQISGAAKTRRARGSLDDARPFFIYVDEFARYMTQDIIASLAELRQYNVGYILAYQYTGQLAERDPLLHESLMNSTGNKVVFRVSTSDAKVMAEALFSAFLDPHKVKHRIMSKQQFEMDAQKIRLSNGSDSNTSTVAEGTTDGWSTSTQQGTSGSDSKTSTQGWNESAQRGRSGGNSQTTGDSWNRVTGEGTGGITTETDRESWNKNRQTGVGGSRSSTASSGWSEGTQRGSSGSEASTRGSGWNKATQEGSSGSNSKTITNSTGSNKGWNEQMFAEKYIEERESSVQFYTLEEQLHKPASDIARLPAGYAFYRSEGGEPSLLRVPLLDKRIYYTHNEADREFFSKILCLMCCIESTSLMPMKEGGLYDKPLLDAVAKEPVYKAPMPIYDRNKIPDYFPEPEDMSEPF